MMDTSRRARNTYLLVYLGLMVLLAATVGAAFLPLGPFHTAVSVVIAIVKAVLVAFFFMHLRSSGARTIVLVGGGVILLLVLFSLTIIDYLTRVNGLPMVH